MIIAIYSRKSKLTEKGESINNQIAICKDYAYNHFDVTEFLIYEDEGFSGGSALRPEFQNMLSDLNEGKFNILICYRLDRISRNISNFSNLMEMLNNKSVGFISVKESFDTTTPMGRAMIYIASVFAQLERETIAERIRDNMHQLARSGRWLGGNTPTGYRSEPVSYIDDNMREKVMYKLVPINEDLDTVKLLYDKYLELRSLQKVETLCLQNNIKTKNNNDFHKTTIKFILTNPVYAIGDRDTYDYFKNSNADLCNTPYEFNGEYGLIGYNKKSVKNNKLVKSNKVNEWIIALGRHKGIIKGRDWVKAQNILQSNKDTFPRIGTSNAALLSGLLKCKICGSFMRITYGPKIKDTDQNYYYYECNMRFNSKRKRCNNRRLNGMKADNLVIESISSLISSKSFNNPGQLISCLNNKNEYNKKISKKIESNEKSIANLVKQLKKANDDIAQYILEEINLLHDENINYKKSLSLKNNKNNMSNISTLENTIINFNKLLNKAGFNEKKQLLDNLVDIIEWDGEYLDIKLNENFKL